MQDLTGRVGESLRTLADVFRNRDLRRLELASAGSVLGNWGYLVALYVYAYDQGGAAAVGLVTVIRMIPAAVTAPTGAKELHAGPASLTRFRISERTAWAQGALRGVFGGSPLAPRPGIAVAWAR